jgi:hypothetical protein
MASKFSKARLKMENMYSWVQYYDYSVVSQTMDSERQQNRSEDKAKESDVTYIWNHHTDTAKTRLAQQG